MGGVFACRRATWTLTPKSTLQSTQRVFKYTPVIIFNPFLGTSYCLSNA